MSSRGNTSPFSRLMTQVMTKKMLAIPLVLVVLVTVWMQGKTGLDFEEACNDVQANEVDSGTETVDSGTETKPLYKATQTRKFQPTIFAYLLPAS